MEIARKFFYIITIWKDNLVEESVVNINCFLILKFNYLYWSFEIFMCFGRVVYTFLPPRLDRDT